MAACFDAGGFECVYDIRMVWAFEAQKRAVVAGDRGELGDRVFRVCDHGAGESVGEQHLHGDAIENHPGGCDPDSVQRVRGDVSWREIAMESFRGVHVHPGGGGVYVFAEGVI